MRPFAARNLEQGASMKKKKPNELARRLQVVRTTIRNLDHTDLQQARGGFVMYEVTTGGCHRPYTCDQ